MSKECECHDCGDDCGEDNEERARVIDTAINGLKQYLRDTGFPEASDDTVLVLMQAALEEAREIMTPFDFLNGVYNLLAAHVNPLKSES